jgi:lipooligosaccharide transport system permease protein
VTAPAVRVAEAHARAYRRVWRSSVSVAFVSPALYLAAMGLGLGNLVDEAGQADLGGLSYAEFLAPGLLAASAMQVAATEGGFPVLQGLIWGRQYFAMQATPVRAADIAAGHLLWVAVRVAITCTAMLAVIAAFGAVASWWGVLAVPAAVLTGAAFAGPVAAYAAGLRSSHGLSGIARFVVMPLFLFSGTFFPVEQLPSWAGTAARAVPLWHGVELCRGLMTDDLGAGRAVMHVAYLVLWTAAGTWLAARRFEKRLVV